MGQGVAGVQTPEFVSPGPCISAGCHLAEEDWMCRLWHLLFVRPVEAEEAPKPYWIQNQALWLSEPAYE